MRPSERWVPLSSLKEGDKFLCGGKIYKLTTAANNASVEVWAENQERAKKKNLSTSAVKLKSFEPV